MPWSAEQRPVYGGASLDQDSEPNSPRLRSESQVQLPTRRAVARLTHATRLVSPPEPPTDRFPSNADQRLRSRTPPHRQEGEPSVGLPGQEARLEPGHGR